MIPGRGEFHPGTGINPGVLASAMHGHAFYPGFNGPPGQTARQGSNAGLHSPAGQLHSHQQQHPGAAALSLLAGSAFHSPGSSVSGPPGMGSDPSMRLAQAQAAAHMQNLQLDWLARAGVYMPRIIDYNGQFNFCKKLIKLIIKLISVRRLFLYIYILSCMRTVFIYVCGQC